MKKSDFELKELLKSIDLFCTTVEKTEEKSEETDDFEYSREELEEKGFMAAQIEEIETGIVQKLPVQHYARTCYNWKQMQEIRIGLLEKLDVSLYDNDLFSAEQMKEIRMGLMDHLDVSSYANLVFSAKDMEQARKNLYNETYLSKSVGRVKRIVDEESGIQVRITADCMKAFVTLPADKKFSVPKLERILKRNDVSYGIIKEQLQKAAEGICGTEEILVAKGKKPVKGKDGRYEYFFDPSNQEESKIDEYGRVDYSQVIVADKKNPGDILARYYPAERGADGRTVTGIDMKGLRGKEKPVLSGQGITRDEKKNLYIAATSGYVMYEEEEGTLNVWNVYVVDGDINRYNGNITYDGIIHIRGSVSDMAQIEASGNVIVDGYVEAATIQAGGDIILRSGMNGSGIGILEAGGKVTGRFFEAATISAKGDVEGNYFLNCNVMTDGSVIAKTANSKILGGSIKAGYSVETYSVMDPGRSMTVIDVGNPAWIEKRLRDTEDRLEKTESELRQLQEGKEKIGNMFNVENGQQNTLFHKICIAIRMKEEESQTLKGEIQYFEKLRKRAKRAYIKVLGRIQSGVILTVCGKIKKTENDLDGPVTFKTEGILGE